MYRGLAVEEDKEGEEEALRKEERLARESIEKKR
jgi:hypothetical protein